MFTVNEYTPSANVYGYMILIGTGTGAYIQMPFNACQECVSPSQIPAAVGLITWAQLAAPAITLSIANSVFLNRARHALEQILPIEVRSQALHIVSGAGKGILNRLDAATRISVVHAIVRSLAKSYILIMTSGALTLVLSAVLVVLLRRRSRGP